MSDPPSRLRLRVSDMVGTRRLATTMGLGRSPGNPASWVAVATFIAASAARAAAGQCVPPPVVNAGYDQVLRLPAIALLDGTVNSDALVTVRWDVVSGPGSVEFRDPTAEDTEVTLAVPGVYVLRLNASDGVSAAGDDVTIVVVKAGPPPTAKPAPTNPAGAKPAPTSPATARPAPTGPAPTVSAGDDQTIVLAETAALNGRVSIPGSARNRFSTAWSLVSGPGSVAIPDARAVRTTAKFAAVGTYVLRLSATDGTTTLVDDVRITVTTVNARPRVWAGPDRSVTLPSTTILSGTASDDSDGEPPGLSLDWSVAKGPGTVQFQSPSAVATVARFAVAGTYVLRLTASDGSLQSHDDVEVVVAPPPAGTELMAAYGFDEGAGTTIPDRSGHELTLTRHGATWVPSGRHNGAIAFDGVNDRLEGSAITLPASFTLMAWLLNPSGMPFETLIAVGTGRAVKVLSQQISFSAPGRDLAFGRIGPSEQWHHVAVTYDGATVRAFLDGVPLGQPQYAALEPFTGSLQLGAWPLGAPVDFLGGWLDDVRIYGRALSQAEIARDMASPISGGRAPDTEPPRVQIDSLADGDTVAEVVTVGAVAADDVGVVGVTFHVDGVALGTELTAPPYWATWDTRTAAEGPHAIHAEARDTGGNVAKSAPVKVTVANPRGPAANRAPVVSAGIDVSVKWPTPALLQGSVDDDGLPPSPGTVTTTWSVVSAPGTPKFERPDAAQTMVRFPVAGIYVLRLTASDGVLSSSDDVTVTVTPGGVPH